MYKYISATPCFKRGMLDGGTCSFRILQCVLCTFFIGLRRFSWFMCSAPGARCGRCNLSVLANAPFIFCVIISVYVICSTRRDNSRERLGVN